MGDTFLQPSELWEGRFSWTTQCGWASREQCCFYCNLYVVFHLVQDLWSLLASLTLNMSANFCSLVGDSQGVAHHQQHRHHERRLQGVLVRSYGRKLVLVQRRWGEWQRVPTLMLLWSTMSGCQCALAMDVAWNVCCKSAIWRVFWKKWSQNRLNLQGKYVWGNNKPVLTGFFIFYTSGHQTFVEIGIKIELWGRFILV